MSLDLTRREKKGPEVPRCAERQASEVTWHSGVKAWEAHDFLTFKTRFKPFKASKATLEVAGRRVLGGYFKPCGPQVASASMSLDNVQSQVLYVSPESIYKLVI